MLFNPVRINNRDVSINNIDVFINNNHVCINNRDVSIKYVTSDWMNCGYIIFTRSTKHEIRTFRNNKLCRNSYKSYVKVWNSLIRTEGCSLQTPRQLNPWVLGGFNTSPANHTDSLFMSLLRWLTNPNNRRLYIYYRHSFMEGWYSCVLVIVLWAH